jgi:hypothetical protein
MTERASFYRKIAYLVGLAVIALVVFRLSTPATATRPGGRLAQLRDEYRLGQANLGEVDPASETMRFLTLGLRNVAITLLWHQADDFKKKEDWTNFSAALSQIAKLQPNFINVWKYQAWNVSYNVSVEFDDYRDRYYYVREGINYLMKGEKYNQDHPMILSELGWFIGHKIGRADEKEQYRKLFREDDDFHPVDRTPDERDNWLVAKNWYLRSIYAVDVKGKSLGKKSPRDLYSDPAKAQINYAEAIEDEGLFDKARRAWVLASKEWRDFGRRPIKHVFGDMLVLGEAHRLDEKADELRAQLDAMAPGIRERISAERKAALSPEERELSELPPEGLNSEQAFKRNAIEEKLFVFDRDVAERIAREAPEKSKSIAAVMQELDTTERLRRYTASYKETINFNFWQMRCDYEQTEDAVAARETLHRAHKAAQKANLIEAKADYEAGFAKWRRVVDEFPELKDEDIVFGDHIIKSTKRYRDVLDQLTQTLGDDYPFWDILEKFDQDRIFAEDIARHKQAVEAGDKP